MHTIPQAICGVIPLHMLQRVAARADDEAGRHARATLEHMRELASGRACTLLPIDENAPPPGERRRVYDARHRFELPGKLVISGNEPSDAADLEALEAWRGSGATYLFFYRVFGRRSIDGNGMRLDATVHYGTGFANAMWNGRQMVYGDGDGRIFRRFTASLDVIAHELTHGFTQHAAALGYTGQTGALNEHISDAFGIMVRQYTLNQSADETDWRIGAGLFGPEASGCAVRSLALPGSAYFHPILGRDPQPFHMDDYVHTAEDNGGVHINSGILNHAFYLAAMAIGGYTWKVLGRIWYAVLTERLTADADFDEFARATIDVAGELYGIGGKVQWIVAEAWEEVGLPSTQQTYEESIPMKNAIDSTMNAINEKKAGIDRCIRALNAEIEHESTPVAETATGRVQRVLKAYRGVKPLLDVLSALPILPRLWRAGIVTFIQVLDSLAEIDVNAEFKAGKDLDQAA
jgi:Thermolysin metallopeptidase, alpha-helical domain/Thermolysin metallopeptidase, catalytic domain